MSEETKTGKHIRSRVVDSGLFMQRLRLLMERKGLSQAELADRADLSRSTLNLFFTGVRKPSADAIVKLADVLDVSTDYLLGRRDQSELLDMLQHAKLYDLLMYFRELQTSDQDRVLDMIQLLGGTSTTKQSNSEQ